MSIDVVQAVKEGDAEVQWADLTSEHNGHKLTLSVFRDAMKFGGVRVPADAKTIQQVADLTYCMLLTPKVVDLIWQQASVKFDPYLNSGSPSYTIVAVMPVRDVSAAVDKKIEAAGDDGGIISSVGKYWVVINRLASPGSLEYGSKSACNYGWCSSTGQYSGVTPGIKVWQSPGFRHNDLHVDPSQVIKLMSRSAKLVRADSDAEEKVDLHDVAADPELAPLISHEGVLTVLRQPSVPKPEPTVNEDGSITMPHMVILGNYSEAQV